MNMKCAINTQTTNQQINEYMYVHIHVYTHIYIYTHTRVCVHTYMHACIHTYSYINIYTYVPLIAGALLFYTSAPATACESKSNRHKACSNRLQGLIVLADGGPGLAGPNRAHHLFSCQQGLLRHWRGEVIIAFELTKA